MILLKKAAAIGLGAALIIGAAGCAAAAPSGPTKLVIYSADPANAKLYKPLLDKWGADNNATVEYIAYPSADFLTNFSPAVNAGAQADVLMLNGQDVRTLWSNKLLAPLDDSVASTDLIPGAVEPFKLDGKQYALGGGGVNVTSFVANQAILDQYKLKVPKTLDDVIAIAAALKGTDKAAIAVAGGSTYLWPIWHMQFIDQASGGKPVETTSATLSGSGPGFDSKVYVDAAKAFAKLGAGGVFENGFQGVDEGGATTLFSKGGAALFYGGTWDISGIAKTAPDLKMTPFKFPNFVSGVESNAFGGPFPAIAIYSGIKEDHKKLANKLANFLVGPEPAQALQKDSTFSLPSNNKVVIGTNSALAKTFISDFLPVQKTFLDWGWPKDVTSVYQLRTAALLDGTITPEQFTKEVQAAFDAAKAGGFKY